MKMRVSWGGLAKLLGLIGVGMALLTCAVPKIYVDSRDRESRKRDREILQRPKLERPQKGWGEIDSLSADSIELRVTEDTTGAFFPEVKLLFGDSDDYGVMPLAVELSSFHIEEVDVNPFRLEVYSPNTPKETLSIGRYSGVIAVGSGQWYSKAEYRVPSRFSLPLRIRLSRLDAPHEYREWEVSREEKG